MLFSVARSAVLALSVVATAVFASPVKTRSPYAIKDAFKVPPRWRKIGPAPKDHIINLQIGLKQSRWDDLERILYEGD